jgi:hemerythrin-like domain-containing protein
MVEGRESLGIATTPAPYPPSATAKWWDESERPSLPHSADDPAYSELGRQVGRHLIDVHDHLRAELTQLRQVIERLRAGAVDPASARAHVAQMTIRQNNWTIGAYCASYCRILTQHHGAEDVGIFPHLRESEPALAPVLDRLSSEHMVIHGVLETVDAAFVAFLAEPGDFTAIDDAIQALDYTLLSHLAYEESQLVEPLARHGFYADQVE